MKGLANTFVSVVTLTTTLMSSYASAQAVSSEYYKNNIAPYECQDRNGTYIEGVCVEASIYGQVAGLAHNGLRYVGGNEYSVGDAVFQGDAKASVNFHNEHFEQIFISVSAIPKDQVLNYNEKAEQNSHNQNRLRANGFVDRPWLLANIGANIALADSQNITILAGSMPVSGLDPLKGKPSRYYMTAPYGLMVRYDKGIQLNYELKNELDRVLLASFSVIDGDGLKGESSVDPADSRANSYPSYAGTMEVRLTNALRKVFEKTSPYLKNHDIYIGVTGSHGDTGSHPGQKRTQDDLTTYLGYMYTSKYGQAEVRVFRSDFTRNAEGTGDGRHDPQVKSAAHGIEVAYRGVKTDLCSWDFYVNKHIFENNGKYPDGEFTYGNIRGVGGWAAGTSCNNLLGVPNLSIGAEYGETDLKYADGKKETKTYPKSSSIFMLTLTYRFNYNQNFER